MSNKILFSALLILTGLLALSLAHADDGDQDPVRTIAVEAARDLVTHDEGAVILDVRMPVEYEMSHISGAINADVRDESFETLVSELDPEKTYIVHCTANPADGRSSRALKTLQSIGFKHLYSLEGGFVAWQEAELPLAESAN